LELGSGAGFLAEMIPDLITSEVFWCEHIRLMIAGQRLALRAARLRALVMTNVLYHMPDARVYFAEAARCARLDGVMALIEP
jgi:hypothetical protein